MTCYSPHSFALLFLLVFLADVALSAMCLAVSTLVRSSSTAVPVSFGVFIIAWVLQLVVGQCNFFQAHISFLQR